MKELFLGSFFAGKELNIVDKQGINRSVKALELINGI